MQQEQATYSPKSLEGCRPDGAVLFTEFPRDSTEKGDSVDILGAAVEVTNEYNHGYKPS